MSSSVSLERCVEQLNKLIEYRKSHEAPVDVMGCDCLGDKEESKHYRFQTLVALMLSAMTRDQDTAKAMQSLKTLKGGLKASVLANSEISLVHGLIRNVGFAQKKAGYIIEAAKICDRDYNGDIPTTFERITAFKGVGVKMATLAMAHCWNQQIGIGVDVHVHRISNRLGWVNTKNPESTETELQRLFPKQYWEPINHTLVGFGQTLCSAKKPKCEICPISRTCIFNNKNDIEEYP